MQNRGIKNCPFELPEDADYCPECGIPAADHGDAKPAAPVNVRTLGALIEASTLDLDREATDTLVHDTQAEPMSLRTRGIVIWSACVFVVALALIVASLSISDDTLNPTPGETSSSALGTDTQDPPDKPHLTHATLRPENDEIKVFIGDNAIATLLTVEGSRYATLDERAESIQVRLNHVISQLGEDNHPSRFAAQANTDAFEVVWRRSDDSSFRIVDVTPLDVEVWKRRNGETSASILANAIADELNATLGTDALPGS